MLILKVFVNEKQIDEVHIHNVGNVSRQPGYCIYAIEKPDVKDSTMTHERKLPWFFLAQQAIARICSAWADTEEAQG